METPAVPSLAVLRPRRTAPDAQPGDRPPKRGPNWDDILFGAAPAAKDAWVLEYGLVTRTGTD